MVSRTPSSPIALVGLSGSGKSTVAPLVAARLATSAQDLDAEIERAAAREVAALFASVGEAAFRGLEYNALERALDSRVGVIACGGGIVESQAARDLLRERCRGVWLEVSPDAAAARVEGSVEQRPLLGGGAPRDRLSTLLERRAGWYAEVARARVVTDGLSADAVAERVVLALEGSTAGGGAG